MTMRDKLELLERRRAESEQGGGRRAPQGAARQGQALGARAARPAARRRHLRRARPLRRAPLDGLRPRGAADLRRRRRHRLRPHRRPPRLRLLAGLHRVRRLAVRGVRREDLQGHGPRDAERRAGDRAQRLRRRAHPGRRRLARRLRRHLPPQHARVRRRPADLARSSARAPAAPCTRRPSPTSRTWCAARRTCSSPGPTS